MVKYLSPKGLEKLKKELDYLKNNKRKEIAKRIKYAASFGDLSENAAYEEAKESQGFLEGRISELRVIINQAKIITKPASNKVGVGSTILIKSDDEEEKFQIVGTEEVDISEGKISHKSALGKAFLNKRKGDKVKVNLPVGKIEYKILEIE